MIVVENGIIKVDGLVVGTEEESKYPVPGYKTA